MRITLAFALVVAILAGGLLSTGCGESKAALVKPTIELFQFQKGPTVDFDDATINSAANAEANVKYGTAKAIYQSVWAANQEAVANQLFPPPYWKGDGVTTKYASLASGDQTAVDGTIFATKLTAAQQDKVVEAVGGLFSLYDEELAAAKPLQQNTAYGILYLTDNSGAMSEAWRADAEAWMTALNAWAGANRAGKTFAQLSYEDRALASDNVFAQGNGTINPQYAFWRVMVKSSFRNGIASGTNLGLADNVSMQTFGKGYAQLNCTESPVVDFMVYEQLDPVAKATVDGTVAFMVTNQALLDTQVFDAKGMTSAKAGFDAEVAGGMNVELALYKWLAYEGLRNSFILSYYPTILEARLAELYPGQAYAQLNRCDQGVVNAAVFAALNPYEQGFANAVIPGLWGKVQAEMTDAIAMDQTTLVRGPTGLRAATGTETAVINWKKDVDGGVPVKTAYYRWLAKEALVALKGLGTLIRLGNGEFLFRVINPNKYAISIDSAQYSFYVSSTALSAAGNKVDTAKVAMSDKLWVPAESELLVKVVAPIKQLDMITWAVMAGQTSANATALSADVWAQFQAGTQTWIISIDAKISDDKGENTISEAYTL